MLQDLRNALAERATYVGSPYHTDIPKLGLRPSPRRSAMRIEDAEESGHEPDCTLCPRKWAHQPEGVQNLLRDAIRGRQFIENGENFPYKVWARDPDDRELVYEAKASPVTGEYHGYPLTRMQSRKLPIAIP